MKIRIALWAFAGALVTSGWWLYFCLTGPNPLAETGLLWLFAQFSCPLVLLGTHFHFGVSLYSAFLSNTLVYGFTGFLVEQFRHRAQPGHLLH